MTGPDPYCWPGTDCLKNKLGVSDPEQLRTIEFRVVSIREISASRLIIPGNYGLDHLQGFHRYLFGDIYAWAGQTRNVDISKPGARFCHWRFMDDQVSSIPRRLDLDGHLLGLNHAAFVETLAHYYGELNVCHPFRERETGVRSARSYGSSLRQRATCSTGPSWTGSRTSRRARRTSTPPTSARWWTCCGQSSDA